MIRYLRLLKLFTTISLERQMAHPTSFFLAFVGKSLRMGLQLVFWRVLFGVARIPGWDLHAAIVFTAFYTTLETSMVITYHRNLFYYLPSMIKKGEFDFLLTKPIPTLFYSSLRIIDCMDASSALVPLGLWIYIFSTRPELFTLEFLGTGFLLLFFGFAILFGVTVAIAATAFWTLTSSGTGRAFEGLIRIARYPIDLLPRPAMLVLTYGIPVAFLASLPSKILLGFAPQYFIIIGATFAVVFPLIGLFVWQKGLRRYTSASS